MTNNLLYSILSAVSYVDNMKLGDTLNKSISEYNLDAQIKNEEPIVVSELTNTYMQNVIVVSKIDGDDSFDGCIFADYNTNTLHVAFRGTQEYWQDLLITDGGLFSGQITSQEEQVSDIHTRVNAYLHSPNTGFAGWSVDATGHSLGGHLARTLSGLFANDVNIDNRKIIDCVVFNAPNQREIFSSPDLFRGPAGSATDTMIYTDPTMWDITAFSVHNRIRDSSTNIDECKIVVNAEGHGIASIVNALNDNQSENLLNTQQYVNYYVQKMISGEITGNQYGTAATFLDRLDTNWSERAPGMMSMFLTNTALAQHGYKVNLDDNYDQDGFKEEFTQTVARGDTNPSIYVNAGYFDDVAFLGKGGVIFDGGEGHDVVSYKNNDTGISVSDVPVNLQSPRVKVILLGYSGEDILSNTENLEGSTGNDVFKTALIGSLLGLAGNDVFHIETAAPNQVQFFDGGDDTDTLVFSERSAPLSLEFVYQVYNQWSGDSEIKFRDIENFIGTDDDDEFKFKHDADQTDVRSIDGGDGEDTLIMADFGSYETREARGVDLAAGTFGTNTTLSSIENVTAGMGYDVIKGDHHDNILIGMGNADIIDGREGDDRIYGATSNDSLTGGYGEDFIDGGGGDDTIDGGADNDIIWGGDYGDDITGGSGNDVIHGGKPTPSAYDHRDTIWGENGDDIIYGELGDDRLYGGANDDTIYGDQGYDSIEGGSGNDDLYGGPDGSFIKGDSGNDMLIGGAGRDTLEGGDNNDYLNGHGNNDTIRGGDGDDIIRAGAGNNALYGGADADVFICGEGYDTIFDFVLGVDKISRSGFENALYDVQKITDQVRITDGGMTLIIKSEEVSDYFEAWNYGHGVYGNDVAAFQAQFSILWTDEIFNI